MLQRKATRALENFLRYEPRKILLVNGAGQIGKSYLIRYVGKNFLSIMWRCLFAKQTIHPEQTISFWVDSLL